MKKNRYTRLIEHIFLQHYTPGDTEIAFERTDIVEAAQKLGISLPKNLGDVVYSFRYRVDLPDRILQEAPPGKEWVIKPAGRARYKFALSASAMIVPRDKLSITKIPSSTPGLIERYALNDEQALLAKLRYNRLIDIFTGLTCYSLQNHLRTFVKDVGQVETDEIYIGLDRRAFTTLSPYRPRVPLRRSASSKSSRILRFVETSSRILFPFQLRHSPFGIT